MPKVTEEYIENKKNEIMDCAMQLIQEIPLYQITMRDIINKLGCSQGYIYRYYKGIDEIYINLMNREIKDIEIRDQIDQCLNSNKDEKEVIENLISLLGEYILMVQEKIHGKFYFEIQVCYAFEEQKKKELLPTLLLKQNLMYIQSKIVQYIEQKIKDNSIKISIPLELLAVYVGDTIEGISNHAALYGGNQISKVRAEMMQLYHMLGDYIIKCIV